MSLLCNQYLEGAEKLYHFYHISGFLLGILAGRLLVSSNSSLRECICCQRKGALQQWSSTRMYLLSITDCGSSEGDTGERERGLNYMKRGVITQEFTLRSTIESSMHG